MHLSAALIVLAAVVLGVGTPAAGATRTVCPSGCTSTTIQGAISGAPPGTHVLVKRDYDSIAAGEVFPIQTLGVNLSITITGEPDGPSTSPPVSTIRVAPSAAPSNDAIIIVTPGSTIRNLKIIPASTAPVHRAIAAAAVGGPQIHLQGLTISNVVIDFTGGSVENGLDLIADTVTIENSTLKGITAHSIFVDGDNYTIQNNVLNGFLGSTGHAQMAIGFGADLKTASQAECSGTPTGYTITGNTISGYVDGVVWCTGLNNNTVSGNTFQDLTGRAIETSGSIGTRIENNIISWTTVGGVHAIGLSGSSFQACDQTVVQGNQITGRPALDVQAGIELQNCVNTQIISNSLSNFGNAAGASIFWVNNPGPATTSLIQGNTVTNGAGDGIAYTGSDSQTSAGDHTQIVNNTVENHGRSGIFFSSARGSGNAVTGNTARANNQILSANEFGYNLQGLANTAVSQNQAFDTRGNGAPPSGAGFFLANSLNLTGGCNSGTNNAGGLLAQFQVTPTFGNPQTGCTGGGTPPSVIVQLNGTSFHTGQTITLTANLSPGPTPTPVDVYIVVQLPNGSFLSLVGTGAIAPGIVPIASGVTSFSFSNPLIGYPFNGSETPGTYTWFFGVTQPGTLNVLGTVGVLPFTFSP